MVKLRKSAFAFVTGAAGAFLGMVMSMLLTPQYERVSSFVDVQKFQNFALYSSLIIGFIFGAVAFFVFMALYPRFQYPASTKLGVWLGGLSGVLLVFLSNVVINTFASSFDFIPSNGSVFTVSAFVTSLLGGVAGVVTGYLFAEVGARNLHYR